MQQAKLSYQEIKIQRNYLWSTKTSSISVESRQEELAWYSRVQETVDRLNKWHQEKNEFL